VKIEFYIPKDEKIPTRLRVKVDETIDVYYERLHDAFGYKFEFFRHQGVTLEMATTITDEIVSRMVSQSYDHGAQWRECGVREVVNNEWDLSITVFFRVRDAG
jgi:hypothetical protein